ncbi:Threonine/homoserine efflux transporter RhtA [Desulfurella multipotens]|uniref:Threonine/homoserine efflux transporter RhtA n=1 Tax=Desulfurella multipotens TaxID=79269 RepID=A0A1G6Q0J5_9BACT|nr:DMT family transporter [Desulfurella multipotens]SDC85165.1 Threonine/homoserine efflux transporter RhtA [Desulfurella multipotens]
MLYVAFVLLILGWSYTAVVTKIALNYIGPFEFTLWRVLVGFLFLFLITAFMKKLEKPKSIKWAFLLGLFQNALPVVFYNLALVYSSAGKVTVLGYIMPFWTILLERLILKTKLEKIKYIPISLSFIGLILIMQPWYFRASVFGYLFAILYGVSWGIGNVVSVIIWEKYSHWDVFSLTFWQMVFVVLVVILFNVLIPYQRTVVLNSYLIFAILYTGIIATAFAWFLWIFLLKKLPASIVGLSSLAIPVFAMIESYIQLHEKFSLTDLIGSFFIILSLLIIYIYSLHKKTQSSGFAS